MEFPPISKIGEDDLNFIGLRFNFRLVLIQENASSILIVFACYL